MKSHVTCSRFVTQPLAAAFAALLWACGPAPGTDAAPPPANGEAGGPAVLTGIDVIARDGAGPLAGRRVGLITNHTGRMADGLSTIDALHGRADMELVALFGPEHGLRGTAEAGEHISGDVDERTGLPIHSLYGETRVPTAEMLEGVDALAFDIQDIGTRYYTYVWTMALAMRTAAENGLRFVVLDRPDPISGTHVNGNVLDTAFATFVGLYPVPMRHGMTAGEMATMLNAEYGIGADLHVVRMDGWRRGMWYDETGLPWIAPSPNMPDLESATHYPGTCLFEGTNLSVGRGTDLAFRQIGAPWVDAGALIERLLAAGLPGVEYEAVQFTPQEPGDGKFPGETLNGIRFSVSDRAAYDPARTAVAVLVALHTVHGDRLTFLERHFDRLAGTDALRLGILAGESLDTLTADWNAQLQAFEAIRRPHLLY